MANKTDGITRRAFKLGLGAAVLAAPARRAAAARPAPGLFAHGGGDMGGAAADALLRLTGGDTARVLLVPFGTRDAVAQAQSDRALLGSFGYQDISVLDPSDTTAAFSAVKSAGLIWFSGSSAKTLMFALNVVPVLKTIMAVAYQDGTVMAGSDAGAAVLSRVMISGGKDGKVFTGAGLGFWPEVIIDRRVSERERQYRLQKLVTDNQSFIGIGLDVGTAVSLHDGRFEVTGPGTVFVLSWETGKLRQQELGAGDAYDMATRSVV